MRTLSDREKRIVRLGVIFAALYLVCFFGYTAWKKLESKRSEYRKLLVDAQNLKRELQPYENRVLLAQKLKENFRMDPQKLLRSTVVADASAAIQKAATSGGIKLGPVRESPARASARELASMQLEGAGPVAGVLGLLSRLESLGYPLIIDSVQITPENKPGSVKMSLTIVILDFDQWKNEKVPNA
jgi:hypothetical protein